MGSFGASKLRSIGSDLSSAVKGFRQGVKEAGSLADLEPKLELQSASRAATVETNLSIAVFHADDSSC